MVQADFLGQCVYTQRSHSIILGRLHAKFWNVAARIYDHLSSRIGSCVYAFGLIVYKPNDDFWYCVWKWTRFPLHTRFTCFFDVCCHIICFTCFFVLFFLFPEMSANFNLDFEVSGIHGYVMMDGMMPALTQITCTFWMRSSDTVNYGTPISYAVDGGSDNAFLLIDYNGWGVFIFNYVYRTNICIGSRIPLLFLLIAL